MSEGPWQTSSVSLSGRGSDEDDQAFTWQAAATLPFDVESTEDPDVFTGEVIYNFPTVSIEDAASAPPESDDEAEAESIAVVQIELGTFFWS